MAPLPYGARETVALSEGERFNLLEARAIVLRLKLDPYLGLMKGRGAWDSNGGWIWYCVGNDGASITSLDVKGNQAYSSPAKSARKI